LNEDIADKALQQATHIGADYADVRLVDGRIRRVSVRNEKPSAMVDSFSTGIGVRVIVGGGWGFAGSYDVSGGEVSDIVETAVRIARASNKLAKKPIKLAPTKTVQDKWQTPIKLDPFEVPIEDILETLIDSDTSFRKSSPHARATTASIMAQSEDKYLVTSEGSKIRQTITYCGGEGIGFAAKGSTVQKRSYQMNYRTMGYENIKDYDLNTMARNAGFELEKLLDADPCPTELLTTLILDDYHMQFQIHETIGHGTELDRVLGTEVDLAGMSFLTPDKRGTFQYGSELVTFITDPSLPTGCGSYKYDDEGITSGPKKIVDKGFFIGYQSSRETATMIDDPESSANMRAAAPINIPLVRMSNVNLQTGDWNSDEIISDTKDGMIFRTTKMWSIDQMRLNFQFGCEIGYKIKNGEITDVIRDPTYTGISYEFWRNVDAIAKDGWQMWGGPICGKGKPNQLIYLAHGASSTRIRDVRIGVSGVQ
jgi:TldD protein